MFDIGWSELVVIGVVALIAIGPKELPGVLRMVGQWMGKARRMASEFQGQFNEAMREAEMADLKKTFDDVRDAAKGLGADLANNNIMTSMQKDATEALKIEDFSKSLETGAPVTPTTPEPPTPATFVEAEAHAAADMPLAIVQENHAAVPTSDPVVVSEQLPPVAAEPTPIHPVKDARAS